MNTPTATPRTNAAWRRYNCAELPDPQELVKEMIALETELGLEKANRNLMIEKGAKLETELAAMKAEFEKIILLAAQAADRNVELRRLAEKAEAELVAAKAECARLQALGSWAHTCIHHTDEQRSRAERCSVCATAEIARLRDELAKIYSLVAPHGCDLAPNGIWETARVVSDLLDQLRAEVKRLKGMRTAAEAIMTDVAEANEELAIARAEKAEAEAQLWHNRFASILWSGALNKHTGGDFQKWEAEFKAEQNALIARAEKAEMLLKQSPHWDTVAIIQNRDNYKEDAEKAEKQFKILNETMQHVTVMYDNAITRAEKAEAEVERLTKENNAAHAALNDSVGHFVYEAAIARAERAEADRNEFFRDKARLDWLAVSDVWFDFPATGAFTPETMRAAIDAAMKEGSK